MFHVCLCKRTSWVQLVVTVINFGSGHTFLITQCRWRLHHLIQSDPEPIVLALAQNTCLWCGLCVLNFTVVGLHLFTAQTWEQFWNNAAMPCCQWLLMLFVYCWVCFCAAKFSDDSNDSLTVVTVDIYMSVSVCAGLFFALIVLMHILWPRYISWVCHCAVLYWFAALNYVEVS